VFYNKTNCGPVPDLNVVRTCIGSGWTTG